MKKQCVYKLNNQGYLLIEQLIALIITSLLITTLLSFIRVTKLYLSDTNKVLLNELEALHTQLQLEAKMALSFSSPNSSTLRIHKQNGEIISYFISDERLMRQVNGKGGEVALYHCESLTINAINSLYVSMDLNTSGENITLYLHSFNLPLPIESVNQDFLEETEIKKLEHSHLNEQPREELNLNDSE